MASVKESRSSRPLSQHRPMSSTTPLNVPSRHATSRAHSHSVSLGTFNPTHRITRRKSMTSNNLAAVVAAVKGIDEASLEAMVSPDSLGFSLKAGNGIHRAESSSTVRPGTSISDSYSAMNLEDADGSTIHDGQDGHGESVILDGPPLAESSNNITKARNRRASEGAYLSKSDGKRASGELRCEKCGKGYKHSSCLTKHLWEHTPEWSYTSKLLISKHQQVQLLEAASVLVTMNQDPSTPGESAKASDSEQSSASPLPSGSSDIQDDDSSSVETTPPPMSEQAEFGSETRESKRYSSNSSVFSRSYQSVPGSISASSFPTTASYGSFHQSGYQRRPSTSGVASNGLGAFDDEAGLAAAVELCNFGTPRTVPVQMGDIPPVPPLPARYVSHNATLSNGGVGFPPYHQDLGLPPPLTHRLSDERDVKMSDGHRKPTEDDDEYYDQRSVSRGRSDEYDDGVFGNMEE